MKKVVVIGAGVSGLACANKLLELGREKSASFELVVLESSGRAGGTISTVRRDGFLWEEGPDSFITEKPWAADLCRRLGLEREMIGTNPDFQRSFVARDGALHPTPEGFYLLGPGKLKPFFKSKLISWPGKLRAAMEILLPPARGVEDESLGSFVRRRFGQEILTRIAQPMVAGVYSADPEFLSVRATFPRFLEMEKNHGSVLRAFRNDPPAPASGPRYGLFSTLKDGLYTLVEALLKRLPEGALRYNAKAQSVTFDRGANIWRIVLPDGAMEAHAVCLAAPAPAAAALLNGQDEGLSTMLREIPYASSATLHLAYAGESLPRSLDGFGFVVPAVEKRSLLGCTFSSVKFAGRAPKTHALLRGFLAGPVIQLPEAEVVKRVRRDLHDYLGIQDAPVFTALKTHLKSMPQYQVGHLDRVQAIEWRAKTVPGLALAGNAYRGIGLPDCVRSGEKAAERIFEAL